MSVGVEAAKPTRREREKLAQRRDMLAAALELFSRKGFRNVSMHEIANNAEFAIGTLYKFFRNKDDLYRSLMLDLAMGFYHSIMEALNGPGSEVDRLRDYVKAKGEMFRNNLPLIRLYLAETHGSDMDHMAGFGSEIRKMRGEVLGRLASIFEEGIRSKRFKPVSDPYFLAVAVDGITNSALLLWLEQPENRPYPDDPDAVLNILFRGLLD